MQGPNRRQVLTAIALAPVVIGAGGVLAGCGLLVDREPDPLLPLAAQARADAALAEAVAAGPDAATAAAARDVASARAAHATALDAEIARRAGGEPAAAPPGAAPSTTTAQALRASLAASAQAAGTAALALPADRVGLVAAVSACCASYAELLGAGVG